MAEMCNAVLLSEDPDILGRRILQCDLARHDLALKNHYDRKHNTDWHKDHQPAPVPYTNTGPLKKLAVTVDG